jgi:hypothetical protein
MSGVRRELEREIALALDLRGRGLLGAIIRDRRGLDDDRRALEVVEHRLAHLLGGLHGHEDGAGWRRERRGPCDQDHFGAAAQGCRREPVAHLARRAVRDVAHRIERLARRAGGDQEPLAREIADRRQ